MKKYYCNGNEFQGVVRIVGLGTEIAPIYKSMYKAWKHGANIMPMFNNMPKFNPKKLYAIAIWDETLNFYIENEDVTIENMTEVDEVCQRMLMNYRRGMITEWQMKECFRTYFR